MKLVECNQCSQLYLFDVEKLERKVKAYRSGFVGLKNYPNCPECKHINYPDINVKWS